MRNRLGGLELLEAVFGTDQLATVGLEWQPPAEIKCHISRRQEIDVQKAFLPEGAASQIDLCRSMQGVASNLLEAFTMVRGDFPFHQERLQRGFLRRG